MKIKLKGIKTTAKVKKIEKKKAEIEDKNVFK